jgi:hypothetical protein
MRRLYQAIPADRRKQLFGGLLGITLLIMFLMNWIGLPLMTPAAPTGIVDFELAGSVERASVILQSWDTPAQLHAALSLGFDYVFMLAYTATFSLACLMSGEALRRRGWPLAGLDAPLAWGQWIAAGLDALENLALILVLLGPVVSPWPALARWWALGKFALLLAGLLYASYGLLANLVSRSKSR